MDLYNKPSPALFLMHYGVKGMKFRIPYLHLPCGMETALRTIPISMNCCLMVSLMASRLSIFLTSSNRVSIEFKMES